MAAAKHLLNGGWELSVAGVGASGRGGKPARRWEDRQRITCVRFVEEFWSIFSRLEPPSRWPSPATCYLFREGLEPSWEAWPAGGTVRLGFVRAALADDDLDSSWLRLCLAALGEQLAHQPAHVCGVELAVRRRPASVRLCVWTRTAADTQAIISRLRDLVSPPTSCWRAQPDDDSGAELPPEPPPWEFVAHQESRRSHAASERQQVAAAPA